MDPRTAPTRTPEERFAACRRDFPSLSRTHHSLPLAYFDGPGGTQVPQRVLDAMMHYYRTCNANTHGFFVTTRESDEALEEARERLALFLGAPSSRCVSFGHNMTSLNFALARAVGRTLRPGDEILITQLDHEANRGPWLGLRELGVTVREIRLLPSGTLDLEDARGKIGERTRLVAMGCSSNFIGTVNDVETIRKWTYEVGAWLSLDAVHYAPHFPLDVAALGTDFLLCSAYKFYGPHIGVLYAREDLLDQLPTDRLRTQDPRAPYRIETGTLNPAAIVGAGAAVDYLASLGRGDSPRQRLVSAMEDLRDFEHGLAKRLARRRAPAQLFARAPHAQCSAGMECKHGARPLDLHRFGNAQKGSGTLVPLPFLYGRGNAWLPLTRRLRRCLPRAVRRRHRRLRGTLRDMA